MKSGEYMRGDPLLSLSLFYFPETCSREIFCTLSAHMANVLTPRHSQVSLAHTADIVLQMRAGYKVVAAELDLASEVCIVQLCMCIFLIGVVYVHLLDWAGMLYSHNVHSLHSQYTHAMHTSLHSQYTRASGRTRSKESWRNTLTILTIYTIHTLYNVHYTLTTLTLCTHIRRTRSRESWRAFCRTRRYIHP